MHEAFNTLFLTIDGAYLHVEGEGFKIDLPDGSFRRLPRINVWSVAIFGNIMISPQAMGRCAKEGRGISFFDMRGRFLARVEGETTGNVLLRRAQHHGLDDPVRRLQPARAFVAGKLQNSRHMLLRSARNATGNDVGALRFAARDHADALGELEHASDIDTLLGIEGNAARSYFAVFASMIRNDRGEWSFSGRNRRPPLDPVNALLSFLYAILTHDVRSALEGVGLDPQVGYLHALRPGRPALALDLMEELRPLVDRFVLRRVNLGQVQPRDFTTRSGGAVELKDAPRKQLLVAWQTFKTETQLAHPLTGKKYPFGLLPHLQARVLARELRGEGKGYLPFLLKT